MFNNVQRHFFWFGIDPPLSPLTIGARRRVAERERGSLGVS